MKFYISGPMTGLPEYNYPAFFAMEKKLQAIGHWQIVNPARLPHQPTWRKYMVQDILYLLDCTHVIMLCGWQNSKGAKLEHHIAKELGITILYEESALCPLSMSLLIRSWITSMRAAFKRITSWASRRWRNSPQLTVTLHVTPMKPWRYYQICTTKLPL